MSSDRYDVMTVREGKDGGKAWFTKIGAMFPSKNGDGFVIHLDALPMDGKLVIRRPLEPRGGNRDAAPRKPAPSSDGFGGDDIPY